MTCGWRITGCHGLFETMPSWDISGGCGLCLAMYATGLYNQHENNRTFSDTKLPPGSGNSWYLIESYRLKHLNARTVPEPEGNCSLESSCSNHQVTSQHWSTAFITAPSACVDLSLSFNCSMLNCQRCDRLEAVKPKASQRPCLSLSFPRSSRWIQSHNVSPVTIFRILYTGLKGYTVNGYFRWLNWRYLPYTRPM